MYSRGGLCSAAEDSVCIAVEGYVFVCRAMYSCGGLCIASEAYV